MRGAIRKRDVLGHPVVTYRSFGGKVLARALLARADRTFLSIVREVNLLQGLQVYVPEVVERCIDMELRARDVYMVLAGKFSDRPRVRKCFEQLARHESEHAELLELCREVAARGRWDARQLQPLARRMEDTAKLLDMAEQEAERCEGVAAAFATAISMERSEINAMFRTVVSACDSEFVKAMRPFRDACRRHLEYLRRQCVKWDLPLAAELDSLDSEWKSE